MKVPTVVAAKLHPNTTHENGIGSATMAMDNVNTCWKQTITNFCCFLISCLTILTGAYRIYD